MGIRKDYTKLSLQAKLNRLMKLFELTFQYHDELNPKLWDGEKLRPEVRKKMLVVAEHFFKSLKVPGLKVEDCVFTGSCANYNYTPYSDLDIHLLIDTKKAAVECKDFKVELFDAKKDLWKSKFEDVKICGYPVEVYVQDIHEKFPVAQGVYSLRKDEWIDEPKFQKPEIDTKEVVATTKEFKKEIDQVVGGDEGHGKAKAIKDDLKKTREKGLHSDDGEFSDENIAFKELRNKGVIGKLMNYIKDKDVERMSLK